MISRSRSNMQSDSSDSRGYPIVVSAAYARQWLTSKLLVSGTTGVRLPPRILRLAIARSIYVKVGGTG